MLSLLHAAPNRTPWPALTVRSSDHPSRPITHLRTIWTGLLEGMTAHHRYDEMMRRGIPHERALKLALGISHASNCGRRMGAIRVGNPKGGSHARSEE